MPAFRIDKLILQRNGSNYNLTGISNAVAGGTAATVTRNGTELLVDITGRNGADVVSFTFNNLDFSGLSENGDEYIQIKFHDTNASTKQENGGVIIKDTKYPPPNGIRPYVEIFSFSQIFDVERMEFTRVGTTANFVVSTVLSYSSDTTLYAAFNLPLVTDNARDTQHVLRHNLTETVDGQMHSNANLQFTNNTVDLNHAYGVSIIAIERNSSISMVDDKKGWVKLIS